MDAQTRHLKESELETWQRNLATFQAQAAGHGMAPPIDIVNQIEAAKRNIKRIQTELDAGQEQSVEATLTGILELLLSVKRQQDYQDAHAERQDKRMDALAKRLDALQRLLTPSPPATAARWASVLILVVTYTLLIAPEMREAISENMVAALVIVLPAVGVAVLLRVLANYMNPIEVRDDDR